MMFFAFHLQLLAIVPAFFRHPIPCVSVSVSVNDYESIVLFSFYYGLNSICVYYLAAASCMRDQGLRICVHAMTQDRRRVTYEIDIVWQTPLSNQAPMAFTFSM